MEQELMPCPVCGSKMIRTSKTGGACCSNNNECQFAIVSTTNHNTLARRAEIGRLVEEIVESEKLMRIHETCGEFDATAGQLRAIGSTLLDALRALAKEVNPDA